MVGEGPEPPRLCGARLHDPAASPGVEQLPAQLGFAVLSLPGRLLLALCASHTACARIRFPSQAPAGLLPLRGPVPPRARIRCFVSIRSSKWTPAHLRVARNRLWNAHRDLEGHHRGLLRSGGAACHRAGWSRPGGISPGVAGPRHCGRGCAAARTAQTGVSDTGVGEIVPAAKCTGSRVGAAVRKILSTPAYRERQAVIGAAIARTQGAVAAAAITEEVVTTRRAMLREASFAS